TPEALSYSAERIASFALAPDGSVVYLLVERGWLQIHDARTGRLDRTLEASIGPPPPWRENKGWISAPVCVAAADGRRVLTCTSRRELAVFELATGTVRMLAGHAEEAISGAFSADGRFVLSGSGDRTLKLWDAASGRCERTLEAGGPVVACAFSPDGASVAGGWSEKTPQDRIVVQLGDRATGAAVRHFEVVEVSWVTDLEFSPDGRELIES